MADPTIRLVAHLGRLGAVHELETARQTVQIRVTPSGLIRVGKVRTKRRRKSTRR